MKAKKCGEFGRIEYRLPNIPEAMLLLGEMGLNTTVLNDQELMAQNELIYMAELIKKVGDFVTKIDLKINNKKITEYSDVLNEFALMPYLSEIGGEILESLNIEGKKKS